MTATLRPATPDDADLLAELVNHAGEGIPMTVWAEMAEQGESPIDVGRRRARRDTGSFSYRNAVMADRDGAPAGTLIDYRVEDTPAEITPETPPMFVPLIELENRVPGAWYVNVLAVRPDRRGHGVGSVLLAEAERRGRARGCARISLIVSDGNPGAVRLYQRTGYREIDRRPIVKTPEWDNPGRNWLLMVKDL